VWAGEERIIKLELRWSGSCTGFGPSQLLNQAEGNQQGLNQIAGSCSLDEHAVRVRCKERRNIKILSA